MEKGRHIGFEVRSLNNMIKRDIEHSRVFEMFRSTGLHGWAIGWFYDNRDRDVFQRDFEEQFSIRRSTASKMLGLMEKNGLIVRQSVESDARLKKIILTDRAIEMHKMIMADTDAREKRLAKNISPEELDCFFRVVNKLKKNLEDKND